MLACLLVMEETQASLKTYRNEDPLIKEKEDTQGRKVHLNAVGLESCREWAKEAALSSSPRAHMMSVTRNLLGPISPFHIFSFISQRFLGCPLVPETLQGTKDSCGISSRAQRSHLVPRGVIYQMHVPEDRAESNWKRKRGL